MDLPDAEENLAELKEQLENPHGKLAGFLFFFGTILSCVFQTCGILIQYKIYIFIKLNLMQNQVKTYSDIDKRWDEYPVANTSCHIEIKKLLDQCAHPPTSRQQPLWGPLRPDPIARD